jgi:transcriptional regulator
MYRLAQYDETRFEVLRDLIREYPFATLVLHDGNEIVANHVPMLLRGTSADASVVGHVARNNPVWRVAPAGTAALATFQGPDHYISPRWYRTGRTDGSAVPTWDYAVVHARGPIEWIEDPAWSMDLLDEMAAAFERGGDPWRTDEMPVALRQAMLARIVSFRIPVVDMRGKLKLNQGSRAEDRDAIVDELEKLETRAARELAAWISRAMREP